MAHRAVPPKTQTGHGDIMSIKTHIKQWCRSYFGAGCMTLIMTSIFASIAFNAAYNSIQKGDTFSPDDGANMVGFAVALFIFVPGGCIAAVFFLHSLLHALKSRRQGRNDTEHHRNTIQEIGKKEEGRENMS